MSDRSIVHATFTLEREYDAPPARVFASWADREQKTQWFVGGDHYELDFRVGGVERARHELSDKVIGWETLYREIVADERIVYTSVLSEDAVAATISLTTVELAATAGGEGTHLTLVEHGAYLDGREKPEWREEGTAKQLDKLGESLEVGAAT